MKQPVFPQSRLIRENCTVFCSICHSSKPMKFVFFGPRKCIGCGNTDKTKAYR